MSLRFAILTSLSETPSTGIELARRFDRSIGYYWTASHQQIYRELDKLERDGLITPGPPDLEASGRGQPRSFEVTEAGTTALLEWIGGPDDPRSPRDSLLVRLRAGAALGTTAARAAVLDRLQRAESALERYAELDRTHFSGELDPAARLQRLALLAGIDTERMWAAWCRRALSELDRVDAP